MRRKFPFFWLLQLLLLTVVGLTSLIAPRFVIALYRGERAPKKVDKPVDALNVWVLGLEQVPPANGTVRDFFRKQRELRAGEKRVWTPHDPSLRKDISQDADGDWPTAEVENAAWDAVEQWILSCQPPPPPEHADAIRAWLQSIDELPEPSPELRKWILTQQKPEYPPKEFRLFILRANQTLPISWNIAGDQVRLSASCILAAALFTLFGLISPPIRRPLARSFVLAILFLTVALLLSTLGPPKWNLTYGALIGGLILGAAMIATAVRAVPNMTTGRVLWMALGVWWVSILVQASNASHESGSTVGQTSMIIVTGLLAIMGVINAHYWLIGPREDPPQDDAGIAQRRPPQLWTLWLVQFVIVLTFGVGTLVFPGRAAELFIQENYDYLTTDVVDDSVRILGAWIITLALLSFFSLSVGQDWMWQGIGWIFCTVFAVLALSTVLNALSGEYSVWGYLYGFQGVLFIPITVMLLMKRDPWSTENVERTRRHWSLVDLGVAIPLLWNTLLRGRRTFYRCGIGARGRLRVLPFETPENPDANGIPASEFFVPGREFPVEARFANRTQDDDASLDIRGCALRLSCTEASPLDLLFQTGSFAPARCLVDYRKMLPSYDLQRGVSKCKVLREGLAGGMRRAPASFRFLSYYQPLVLEWLTPNAGHYLVRFRLIPKTDIGEAAQGLPDEEDLQHLWNQERRSGDTRSSDYLRQELRDYLNSEQSFSFRLDAQFHRPCCGDSIDWYDASLEWDERTHAWYPLAELEFDQALTPEESDAIRFDPTNLPVSLRVPMPENFADVYDPRSLAAAQYRVAGALGRLRTWRCPPPVSLRSVVPRETEGEPTPPDAGDHEH